MAQFNPQQHVRNVARPGDKPRWYLDVKWRILWFRTEHPVPSGRITTSIHELPSGLITVHASVWVDDIEVATGMATVREATDKREQSWAGRVTEKAETAAIGRALDLAGYGTQFMDGDGSHLADTPVEQSQAKPTQPKAQPPVAEPPPPASNGNPVKYGQSTLDVETVKPPNGKQHMLIEGARLYSRDAFRALGFHENVLADLDNVGQHLLSDSITITYIVHGSYNSVETVRRDSTGQIVDIHGKTLVAARQTA